MEEVPPTGETDLHLMLRELHPIVVDGEYVIGNTVSLRQRCVTPRGASR